LASAAREPLWQLQHHYCPLTSGKRKPTKVEVTQALAWKCK